MESSIAETRKFKLRLFVAAFFAVCFFTFDVQNTRTVYPVFGRGKFRLKGLLFIFFLFFAGLAFVSPAHGADVFYSVGQSTADLKTGTPTVTITSGAAVFSAAQTGNIGVGDRVTYNTDQIAYVSAKTHSDGMHWNLITATGGIPADITTSTVVSIKHEYTTINSAVAGASDANHINNTDLTAANVVLNIPCYYDSAADTTAVAVTGYTTGASNYIKIYTPSNTSTEANNSQRHQGKWDDGKYRLAPPTHYYGVIGDYVGYLILDGLQLLGMDDLRNVVNFGSQPNDGRYSILKNSIIKSDNSVGMHGVYSGVHANNYYVYNNLFIDVMSGVYRADGNMYIYNNTIIGSVNIGIYSSANRIGMVKNNVVQNSTVGYYGTFNAASENNISQDATSPNSGATDCGGHSCRNQTVSFADAANNDFHLSPTDTAAKNAGADLSADADLPVTTDIDGQTRPTGADTVDIGADEAATAIYYSVGQNTTSHETGSGTVTIDATARTATFSVAQTATNMGVGDLVTYTGGSCYITSKTSTSVWGCQSATGTAPTAATDADVTSISHAFSSLRNTISTDQANGAFDSAHLNTNNLYANNYQLNVSCYNDSGPDNGTVFLRSWITAAPNYIRIYTPYDILTEVNQSQRHTGKPGTGYILSETDGARAVVNYTNFVRFEGLEMSSTGAYSFQTISYSSNNSDVRLEACLLNKQINLATVPKGSNQVIFYNNTNSYSGTFIDQNANSNIVLYVYNSTLNGRSVIRDNNTAYYYNNIIMAADAFIAAGTYPGVTVTGKNNSLAESAANGMTSCVNCRVGQTFSFVNAGVGDYHLTANDAGAKNYGVDLQHDSYFAFDKDVDGQVRTAPWDIGADQFFDGQLQSQISSPNLENGLVGHWTFDGSDISGATAKDISGNNNNGTISGASPTMGKLGQGMNFDTAGDVLAVPDSNSLDGMAQLTLSAWINPKSKGLSTGYGRIIDKNNSVDYNLNMYNDDIECNMGGVTAHSSSEVFSGKYNQWHHVLCIYDGSQIRIYLGRVEIASAAKTGVVNNSSSALRIGNSLNGDRTFDGKIDDVRIYDRALSIDEIGMLYHLGQNVVATPDSSKGNTNGLVGHWSFDGTTINGSTVNDLSGNGNNGTISGATKTIGKLGQGMGFNTAGNYINAGSAASLDDIENQGGGGMTISAWVRPNQFISGFHVIVCKNEITDISGRWWFAVDSTGSLFFTKDYSISSMQVRTNDILALNSWQHVVATWDGSASSANGHIYVNGSEVSYASRDDGQGSKNSDAANDLYIANALYGSRTLFGNLDDVRIYNRVLDSNEIANLYHMGQTEIRK